MSFRLISTVSNFRAPILNRDLLQIDPSRRSNLSANLTLEFTDPATAAGSGTALSIIIGSNGTGKSRLLGDIAQSFIFISRRKGDVKNFPLQALTFELNGKFYSLEKRGSFLNISVDGRPASIENVEVPRIMALTLTPFDKFPLPRFIPGSFPDQVMDPNYAYFGLRDYTNRASITSLLYRSLERLIDASKGNIQRRRQVVGIFNFLGYKARLQIVYRLDVSLKYLNDDFFANPEQRQEFQSTYRMRRALERGIVTESEVKDSIDNAARLFRGNQEFPFDVNFEDIPYSDELLRSIHILRSVGLLRLRAVELERADGAIINLKEASSGELSIVTGFLSLASTMEDSNLVLIDEPEISLHPAWQNRYVELLLGTFANYRGCHYLVATHSPLILSDISKANSRVVFLDREDQSSSVGFAGQSPDYLLVNAFRAPGKNNYYLKQEIVNALRLVADRKVNTDEFQLAMKTLSPLLERLDPSDPVRKVISDLETFRKEFTGARE